MAVRRLRHGLAAILFLGSAHAGAGAAIASDAAIAVSRGHLRATARTAATMTEPVGRDLNIHPQIFLLFMVMTKINHEEVWDRFLDGGERGSEYTALVHCKSAHECRHNIRSDRFEIIPSVQTSYCTDLVSGMNALLAMALRVAGVGNPQDKFVFVSDSTVPVKPFSYVYKQLTEDSASDFCIFPRNEWAEVSEFVVNGHPGGRRVRIQPKHHQWLTLNRRHAEIATNKSREHLDLMFTLQLNMGFSNTGCLDEFWHFRTVFPDADIPGGSQQVDLADFAGGPLSTALYEVQGRCDTFVHWVPRASGSNNNITRLSHVLQTDPGTEMEHPTDSRPATFRRFSLTSLSALRDSPFLFARKVDASAVFSGCATLDEAFSAINFAATPQRIKGQGRAWKGEGTWLDNRRSKVVIDSADGSASLSGADADMQATGYYCGDRLEVTFKSGYRASATVSSDGRRLRWSNGVVWPRAALS